MWAHDVQLRKRGLGVIVLVALLAAAGGCRTRAGRIGVSPEEPVASAPQTTAERLLILEGETPDEPELRATLQRTLERAVERCRASAPAAGSESEVAFAFFVAVDRTLTEEGFIFPPRGLIELLHQAMRPRTLPPEDVATAVTLRENRRRTAVIQQIQASGGPFRVLDCDLACVLYLAVAERLGHPVKLVVVPNHMFVRWPSPSLAKNWDPNLGWILPDEYYATSQGVTDEGRTHLGWLEVMPPERITSYWHSRIGDWHDRHGRHVEALRSYHQALAACPDDPDATNRLAWCLATCPRADLRDPAQAVALAAKLVARSPRREWVDTLAAAQAEAGDFAAAIATIQGSPRGGAATPGGAGASEVETDSSDAVRAYARGMTYRQGVAAGIIYDPRPPLPYDD